MRTDTIISSPTTVAVVAKDLIARGIPLHFELTVENPSRFLSFPCLFGSSIHMVNSQKLRDGLATTSTDVAPIGIEGIVSISLAKVRSNLTEFLSIFGKVFSPIFLILFRMCTIILPSMLSSLFRILAILFSSFTSLVSRFIILLSTSPARRVIPTTACFTSAKLRDGFNFFTLTTLLHFHSKFIIP